MFKNLSIRKKLISIILFVTIFSVIFGFSMFLIFEIQSTKKELVNNAIMNARLISEYSIRPLMFDYPEEGKDILDKLKSISYIKKGTIFNKENKLFATYNGNFNITEFPHKITKISYLFNKDHLLLYYPITYQDQYYGALYLQVSTEPINKKFYNIIFWMLIILFIIVLIAYFLSYKLQLLISGPILELADITQAISERADYSLQVKRKSNDEIGRLYDNFNKMLRRIHTHVKERDKAEKELIENERRIRTLLELTPDSIWIKDIDGKYKACNPKFESYIGLKEKDIINKTAFDLLPKKVAEEFQKCDKQVIEKKEQISKENEITYASDGHHEIVEAIRSPLFDSKGEVIGIFGIARDITERKRDETMQEVLYNIANAVTTAEDMDSFYKIIHTEIGRLIDAANFHIGLYDDKRNIIQLPYACDSKDKFNEMPAVNSCSSYVMKNGESVILTERDIKELADKGSINFFGTLSKLWVGVPLKIKDKVIGIIVVKSYDDENAYDDKDVALLEFISEQIAISITRKRAEDALRQSEERLRLYVENAHDGIMINGANNLIEYGNPELSNILGYELDEIIGKDFIYFLDEESREKLSEELEKSGRFPDKNELNVIRKSGDIRKIEISSTVIKDSTGEIKTFSHLFDVTESYHLREQLYQSQKMEAVGQLAGGVAHDFNNLLTVIQGYIDLLLLKKDFTGKDREKMLQIKSASTRAEALTRQLLAFSRKQMVQPKVIQLNTIINNSFKMFTRLIGEDIKIELLLAEDLPTIVADSHQIEQILINLIVNARDAIRLCGDENERSIKIRTQRTYLDQKYAKKHGIKEGHYVELSISDTGIGMNKQTLDKIFEPFYTTKDQGKGTGLGLSTVYGIVKQNNATINVYSEENNGSIFRIYWPVSEQEIEKLTANSSDAIHKGKERILLVEDDHDVRELGEESLLSLGYTVYTACDAQEALRKIKDEKINPHLLITDVIMPGMSGEELAREVTNLLPDIAVIFTSGYTNDHIVIEGFIDKDINFLGKPYTISTLSQKIAEVLRQENN